MKSSLKNRHGTKVKPDAKPKRVKVSEIAKSAGISPAAVSSLLRSPDGKGRVSEKTRLAILKACRDLGYEPQNSPAFNRIYPELGDYCFALSSAAHMGFRNPYYSQLLRGVTESLPNVDGHMHFCRFQVEVDYLANPDALPPPIRNGVATKILCAGRPNLSFVEALRERRLPLVYLGQEVPLGGITCFVPDFEGGVREAINHLVKLGHHDIALAAGPLADGSSNILRQRLAFENALAAAKLPLRSDFIFFGPLDAQGGTDAINRLMECRQRPTALYCLNDMAAIGAIQHAHVMGLRVPEDLSVMGFDDIWLSQSISPALTTIQSPIEEMAIQGIQEIERMSSEPDNHAGGPRVIVLPTHFIERKSTARPGKT